MKHDDQALASNFERQQELTRAPRSDIAFSKTMRFKESHYYNKRQQDTVTKHTSLKNESKRPNAAMTIAGVEHTPLLMGQVQIGTIHSSQRGLLIEELMIRVVDVDPKELLTKLKKKLWRMSMKMQRIQLLRSASFHDSSLKRVGIKIIWKRRWRRLLMHDDEERKLFDCCFFVVVECCSF